MRNLFELLTKVSLNKQESLPNDARFLAGQWTYNFYLHMSIDAIKFNVDELREPFHPLEIMLDEVRSEAMLRTSRVTYVERP